MGVSKLWVCRSCGRVHVVGVSSVGVSNVWLCPCCGCVKCRCVQRVAVPKLWVCQVWVCWWSELITYMFSLRSVNYIQFFVFFKFVISMCLI